MGRKVRFDFSVHTCFEGHGRWTLAKDASPLQILLGPSTDINPEWAKKVTTHTVASVLIRVNRWISGWIAESAGRLYVLRNYKKKIKDCFDEWETTEALPPRIQGAGDLQSHLT